MHDRSARVIDETSCNEGKVVERGATKTVLQHPTHSYTVKLLDAVAAPSADAGAGADAAA